MAEAPSNGNQSIVVLNPNTGASVTVASPFAGFNGPISVAMADINHDGISDLIVAAGAGGGPRVVVLAGTISPANSYQTVIADFFAYEGGFTGGVSLAAGDLYGNGQAEIVTGAGPGGGPDVRVFQYSATGMAMVTEFMAYELSFTGGVNVAVGNVNGTSIADIATGAGPGGGPRVRIFNAQTLNVVDDFFAYAAGFTGGVRVAIGDVTSDGATDFVTAPGAGGGPDIRVFNSNTLNITTEFMAYEPGFSGGVNVAVGYVFGNYQPVIVTGPGLGGGARVRTFKGDNGDPITDTLLVPPNYSYGAVIS